MIAAISRKASWKRDSSRKKSQRYICTACGGVVYSGPAGRGNDETVCNYPYCPHCLAEMDVKEGSDT